MPHDSAESAQISLHRNKIKYWLQVYTVQYSEVTVEVNVLNSQTIKEHD